MSFQERIKQISREREDRLSLGLAANDNEFTSRYFAVESIRNLPACLDLRFPDASRVAIPYSFFIQVNYNPDDGIEIITSRIIILVHGRNLEALYDYLSGFRVRFIQANAGEETDEAGLFIKEIIIKEAS